MMKSEIFLTTITLSEETYSALLLKVAAFYQAQNPNITVLTSQFLSDRFSKMAYYFAVVRYEGVKKGHTP